MIIRLTTTGGMPCVRLRLPTATGLHPAHSDLLQAAPACGSAQRPVLPGSGEGVGAFVKSFPMRSLSTPRNVDRSDLHGLQRNQAIGAQSVE